jgi:hypothetical protein
MTQQPMTCTPLANGSCAVFNGTATTTIDSNGTKTTVFNTQTVCDDGSHADSSGMCHYPICPDGSTPVGKGTCVGPEMGECIHAADGNGNCQGITYCGGPAINVAGGYTSCPATAPTNTSLTLPPPRCDQPGYPLKQQYLKKSFRRTVVLIQKYFHLSSPYDSAFFSWSLTLKASCGLK